MTRQKVSYNSFFICTKIIVSTVAAVGEEDVVDVSLTQLTRRMMNLLLLYGKLYNKCF